VRQDRDVLLSGGLPPQIPARTRTVGATARAFAAELPSRLSSARAADELLGVVAELVATHAAVPFVTIEVELAGLGLLSGTTGAPVGLPFTLPLISQGRQAGQLCATGAAAGRPVTGRQSRVLAAISPHLAAAVRTAGLLSASRQNTDRVLYAREEERRVLRQELHDSLGPILAGISLGLHAAQRVMRRDPHRAEQLVGHLEGELLSAMAEVRRLFETLRPAILDHVGLVAAVGEQTEILGTRVRTDEESTRDVTFSYVHEGDFSALPAVVEVAAYRIVCEALTNVVRHSHAKQCTVSLRRADTLTVEIVDDGIGIDGAGRRGVGLGSMRDRANELGGSLTVAPVAGGGTRVMASLPIQPDPGAARPMPRLFEKTHMAAPARVPSVAGDGA
jgi:two-component system, NarL family, sensor kinase